MFEQIACAIALIYDSGFQPAELLTWFNQELFQLTFHIFNQIIETGADSNSAVSKKKKVITSSM